MVPLLSAAVLPLGPAVVLLSGLFVMAPCSVLLLLRSAISLFILALSSCSFCHQIAQHYKNFNRNISTSTKIFYLGIDLLYILQKLLRLLLLIPLCRRQLGLNTEKAEEENKYKHVNISELLKGGWKRGMSIPPPLLSHTTIIRVEN